MRLRQRLKKIIFLIIVISVVDFTNAQMQYIRRFFKNDPELAERSGYALRQLEQGNSEEKNSTNKVEDKEEEEGDINDLFYAMLERISHGTAHLSWAGKFQHLQIRACYMIATTYMGAQTDLRRYLTFRYFYEKNVEFEIGYMVSEIITKYQKMLEMFYMVQNRYVNLEKRTLAPFAYMVYMYTTILEMSTVIKHLCAMIKEIEKKYYYVPKSGFLDYHIERKKKDHTNDTEYIQKKYEAYQRRIKQEQKRREKQRKKLREKNLVFGFSPTPPARITTKKGKWPLNYGWSIEDW